jgi:hypothetical protein
MREVNVRVSASNDAEVDELRSFLEDNNYIYELDDNHDKD